MRVDGGPCRCARVTPSIAFSVSGSSTKTVTDLTPTKRSAMRGICCARRAVVLIVPRLLSDEGGRGLGVVLVPGRG
jgi:hypothetical protein